MIQNIRKCSTKDTVPHPTLTKLSGKNLKSHRFLDDTDKSPHYGLMSELLWFISKDLSPSVNVTTSSLAQSKHT